MRHLRATTGFALLLMFTTLFSVMLVAQIPRVRADLPYSLNPVPAFAQEGSTVSLVLSVNNAQGGALYSFIFSVTNPSGKTVRSPLENFTTSLGQTSFNIVVAYPSPSFLGSNSLVGQYATWVDQIAPTAMPRVATSTFTLSITDSLSYERTQTVSLQASGYNASERVTVAIRTQTTSTLVFSQTITATATGMITVTWKIPVNATIDIYSVTLTGTSTFKNPPDLQRFSVRAASMSIAGITSTKLSFQRTETLQFSFQPSYPDGSPASTGVALLTLERPDKANITLTATYNSASQAFSASYPTTIVNQTGTWTAILVSHAYSDAYGNTGPGSAVTKSQQLTPAILTINVTANTNFAVGQQTKFNASITYPDGTILQTGGVAVFLVYSGTPTVNDTVPVVFDTGLRIWIGTYTPRTTDPGGLWSLVVKASDSSAPPNTGLATRAITLQNNTTSTSGNVSFPLWYFAIIAALIAALLVAVFLVFKRRKVTHATLKIDLEAVKSEAGRIESQDFFQSVEGQVKKDKQE